MARAAPCPPEDLQWAIAVARLVLPPEIHVQAPPNLSDDLAPLLARRHRRLGRRLPRHRRPRQPRAGLAGARRAARGHRGGRARAGAPAHRLPRRSPSTPSAGSTRRCASPCSTPPTPRGWPATPPGARGARMPPPDAARRARGVRPTRPPAAVDARTGRRWRRGRGPGRRGPRPGGGRRRRSSRCSRARGPEVRLVAEVADDLRRAGGGRRRDLRAQPQHQLHERVHVQVPLLRLLQGPAVAEPARRALPARARRDHAARGRGRGRGRHRGLPAGRHPPRTSTATTTSTCSRRCAPASERHPHPRLHRARGDRGGPALRACPWPST